MSEPFDVRARLEVTLAAAAVAEADALATFWRRCMAEDASDPVLKAASQKEMRLAQAALLAANARFDVWNRAARSPPAPTFPAKP